MSFNIPHLEAELAHKVRQSKEILAAAANAEGGARPTTPDENKLFDDCQRDIADYKKQIAAAKETITRQDILAEQLKALEQPQGRQTKPDQPQNGEVVPARDVASFRIPASARRSGKLKAFTGPEGELKAYRSGLWARATIFGSAKAQTECLKMGIQIPDIRAAMSTTSNPDGGFLVPDELSQAIIDLREVYGVFRRECRVWPMGSDTLHIPRRAGGITIGPIGENPSAGITQSTPTFNQVLLVAKKCGGLSLISSEISEDAVIDLGDWIASEFAYAFALYEDTLGFSGDGTSAHLGIQGLTTLFTGSTISTLLKGAVAIPTVTHDLWTEVDVSDIAALMAALPLYAKINAKFYCSSVAQELVFNRLKAVAGGNNVQTLQGTTGDNYLGYPIVVSQVLPAVSATTAINDSPMFFFGDLSKSSALGDRRTMRVFPSEHRYMDTDQVGIRATERIDIVHNDIGDASTAGPIVALIGSTS